MALFIEMYPKHLEALGIITVRWAHVDRVMYSTLKDVFGMADEAEKLRECRAGQSRLEYFIARVKAAQMHDADRAKLVDAASVLTVKMTERNHIIHGQYGVMMGADDLLAPSYSDIGVSKSDKIDRREAALVTVEHLMAHADEVREASKPISSYLYARRDS
ncbi:hypothetical protein BH10PLA2_BH10PLA2_01050 [soil metagenome]